MFRIFPLFTAAAVLLSACITIQPQQVEITPGTVSPQIEGARWPQTPIAYCTVRDEQAGYEDYDTFVALTQRAMAAWAVPTTYEGDCAGGIVGDDGTNEVGWGELGEAPGTLNEAGNTNIRYRTTPGGGSPDIIEADITIEREPARGRSTEECLYTTLLHETGHLFGVPHLEQGTVMSPVIEDCLQELTPADRASLATLY